jgi:hypothetical protein
MINRSVSGDGAKSNADMIQSRLGIAISSTRMAAPISQFRTTKILRKTYAIGSAAE